MLWPLIVGPTRRCCWRWTRSGDAFALRRYQRQVVAAFAAAGSGVVVPPCGSGRTLVGIGAVAAAGARTLVLVTNIVAGRQWRDELLGRTTLTEAVIGGCSGARKEVRPVTIAICQIVVVSSGGMHPHMEALSAEDWGIVVYVEVHLLSASVFQMAADISSRCRLGLTATLVREDGCEGEVFSRVGLKRFEVRWRDVEARGWIAPAVCAEVRVTLNGEERMVDALAEPEERYRVGASA